MENVCAPLDTLVTWITNAILATAESARYVKASATLIRCYLLLHLFCNSYGIDSSAA